MSLIFFLVHFVAFPGGFEVYEGVLLQTGLTNDYTAAMLKDDMVKYLNTNADFFTVSYRFLFFLNYKMYSTCYVQFWCSLY